ncbi:energy transducer TonB [Novosphingobium soli]|uniref:Energy transducer TonB n=1 Tax=Novosphingobium soli TaxID=574956 RepID=A0ABV6CSG2_9SPHN
MRRIGIAAIWTIALIAGALGSRPAEALTAKTLPPATPWNLEATDAGCALRRAFGPPDRSLVLEIRRFQPGDGFELSVDGDDLAGLVHSHSVTIGYGTLWKHEDSGFQLGTTTRGTGTVPSIFLSSALKAPDDGLIDVRRRAAIVTPEMEAGVDRISLSWSRNNLILNTGSLGKPFAAMRSCTDALLRAWGLDPEVQNGLTRYPAPTNLMQMVRAIQAVYPASMAATGKQGRVNFRAIIDGQGSVTRCETIKSYNDPEFDALACKVVRRTRFNPALDRNGKPVDSYYAATVKYYLG